MERHQLFQTIWQGVLKNGPKPAGITGKVEIDFSEFSTTILDANHRAEDAKRLVELVYGGRVLIIRRALSSADVERLKNLALTFETETLPSSQTIKDGCPDFHQFTNTTGKREGYTVADHSYYFFRWNQRRDLFKSLSAYWTILKTLNGLSPDSFEQNTPSQGWVDRIQIIQYPKGGGHISCHRDPDFLYKSIFGFYLSTPGTDFREGGFYLRNPNNETVLLEENVKSGDCACWYPNIPHGVMPIDPTIPMDVSSHQGRWFLALNSVQAHGAANRHYAEAHA